MLKNSLVQLSLVFPLCFVVLSACGGGGGPQNPDPVIDPVEQITEADLVAAGVPALPMDNAGSSFSRTAGSRGTSITSNMDFWGFVDDGAGRLSISPTNLPARRIVGWALYRAQADEVGESIPLAMRITGSGFGGFRTYYAVGNYSTGKWEIGGRNIIDLFGAGFSLGNDYASPQGNLYFLIAVGHPGSGNLPAQPVILNHEEVWWAKPSMPFAGGTLGIHRPANGDVQLDYSIGGEDTAQIVMEYSNSAVDRNYIHRKLIPSFPAEFNLTSFKGSDEELQALWGSGVPKLFSGGAAQLGFLAYVESPVILYHNTNDLNGARYPFSLHATAFGDANLDGYISSLEIELTATYGGVVQGILRDGTSNTLAAVPDATVSVLNAAEELLFQTTTDAKGIFSFELANLLGGSTSGVSSPDKAPSIPTGPVNFILGFMAGGYGATDQYCSATITESSEGALPAIARIDFFEDQSGWGSN